MNNLHTRRCKRCGHKAYADVDAGYPVFRCRHCHKLTRRHIEPGAVVMARDYHDNDVMRNRSPEDSIGRLRPARKF